MTSRDDGGATGGVGGEFVRRLAVRLANIAVRTLVTELNQAWANGILMGATSRDRFIDFVRRLAERDAGWALLTKCRVLARLLGQACVQAIATQVELLHRLAGDRAVIVDQLLNGVDPGPLSAIEPGAGDFHQRGRSVSVVQFANVARVVYKPRCQPARHPSERHHSHPQPAAWQSPSDTGSAEILAGTFTVSEIRGTVSSQIWCSWGGCDHPVLG